MKPAQKLLMDAAEYMEKHGFSPHLGSHGESRCLIGAMLSAERPESSDDFCKADDALWEIVSGAGAKTLIREGWNTQDAVAALRIAADLAA